MASLEAVYRGDVRMPVAAWRILTGLGVVLAGGVTVIVALALATTGLGNAELGLLGARRLAGAIGGLALLGMIAGGFVALPAHRETLIGAVAGLALGVLGVGLFAVVYPAHWLSSVWLTLVCVGTFLAGVVVALWSLFVAVATFQTRQHPGGSARIRVTETGRLELVETPEDGAFSGVGLFGLGEREVEPRNRPGTPSGEPETAADGGNGRPG